MIKLLAIDMDKTCLNDENIISENTLNTLRQLAKSGVIIIPTTGRALDCLPHQLLNEFFYKYVISSNGARIIDIETNTNLYTQEIKEIDALSFLKDIDDLNIGLDIHINNHFLVQGKLFHLVGKFVYGKDADRAISTKKIIDYIKNTPSDIEEIQVYFFSKKTKQKLIDILFKYPCLSYAFTDHYVEIYSKNTSKGTALNKLAKSLNIKKEEIAACGDGENDLSMFEYAGLKLAMGNANELLKSKADIILPSNNEDGICEISRYIKNK